MGFKSLPEADVGIGVSRFKGVVKHVVVENYRIRRPTETDTQYVILEHVVHLDRETGARWSGCPARRGLLPSPLHCTENSLRDIRTGSGDEVVDVGSDHVYRYSSKWRDEWQLFMCCVCVCTNFRINNNCQIWSVGRHPHRAMSDTLMEPYGSSSNGHDTLTKHRFAVLPPPSELLASCVDDAELRQCAGGGYEHLLPCLAVTIERRLLDIHRSHPKSLRDPL